jgi:glycosyltransferase involved in cell wall biosynthesis
MKSDKKLVFVNQAVNFLTVDIVNSFAKQYDSITLITGNIHAQGTELDSNVKIDKITRYNEHSFTTKTYGWTVATTQVFFKLLFKYRKHEIFFVSIPPMAYLAMLILRNRFTILVWDVYPDTLKIYGIGERNPLYRFWAWANRRIFNRAANLFTIGDKMAELVSQYVDRAKVKVIRLWTTFENFTPVDRAENFFIREHLLEDKFIVQYSGNIGLIHNVEVMVEIARLLRDNSRIIFLIIGKGDKVNKIKGAIKAYGLQNCKVLPFQPDHVFPYSLSAADLGVVILDNKTSKGSIPNKAYNLMTAGKPILYIASPDSELKIYAEHYNNGKCFADSELDEIADFIVTMSEDEQLVQQYRDNSLNASLDFTRKNTVAILEAYN